MIEIPLTKGFRAIVDDEDAELAAFRWHVTGARWGHYGQRSAPMVKGVRGATIMLHRAVLERAGVDLTDKHVDHINGDTLDNRRANLRAVTVQENARNLGGVRRHNTSGVLGVSWDKSRQKWTAFIVISGKMKNLGRFETAEEAAGARLKAERELWGVQPRRAQAHEAA